MANQMNNPETHFDNGNGLQNNRLKFKQMIFLGLVAVAGLIVSVMLFGVLWQQEKQMAEVQFQLFSEKKLEAVKQAISNQFSVMSLFKAFYNGSREVDRNEFKTFTDSILKEHPEIKTLAWMPRIPADQRLAFEETAKQTVHARYGIVEFNGKDLVPAADRNEYFPVQYIEPIGNHSKILGFDLGSLPEFQTAMSRATSSNSSAVSYCNIPGCDSESGCTIHMIEEAQNEPPSSEDDSNPPESASGFVLGIFSLDHVVKKALELLPPAGVDVYIFDVTDGEKTRLLISWPSQLRMSKLPVLELPPPENPSLIQYRSRINVADHQTWLFYCTPSDIYFNGKTTWLPWMALLSGLLITGLAVGYLYLLSGRTARIEKLVLQRTQELQASETRFRLLVENAADGLFIYDGNGNIIDVNQQACDNLGYSREELLKMHTEDFEIDLKPEEVREITTYKSDAYYPDTINGVHRRKDGSTYPVEVRVSRMEIAG